MSKPRHLKQIDAQRPASRSSRENRDGRYLIGQTGQRHAVGWVLTMDRGRLEVALQIFELVGGRTIATEKRMSVEAKHLDAMIRQLQALKADVSQYGLERTS